MELNLKRIISTAKGTNGFIELDLPWENEIHICKCIELPWHNNEHEISCIPTGRYQLNYRHNLHFGDHLILLNVPDRSLILIHPANDALKELRGCIAPVTSFNGVGNGNSSRAALAGLMKVVMPAFERQEEVFLNISNLK
ncbi:MAG: DUF5675 family protein [Ginsengibacter sp.]